MQEVKQQGVPLRVHQELAVDIIRTKQYQHRDEISLILEASGYIKERLPVHRAGNRHLAAAGCSVEGMKLVEETLASRKAPAEANGK